MAPGVSGIGGGARGAVMTFTRQRTNRDLLEIDWNYPKSVEIAADDDGHTRAAARMFKLSREEAFSKLAEGDRRPLLVMRECGYCKGTDDALLSQKLDNEKTLLMTRWFRCVKLQPNVTEKNHTYHALFEGEHPPHLFLCMPDGSGLVPLDGRQGQSSLWRDMEHVLGQAYEKSPNKAVKKIFRVMAKYDTIDAAEDNLREQLEAEIEKRGPRSPKVRQLRAKLAKLAKQRESIEREHAKARDLGLRTE